MNLLKTLTVGMLAVAMTGMASATPTIVHVTGSTAFRAAATVGIINQLGGTSCRAVFYGGSPIGKAIFQIFANGTIGSGGTATTIVEAQWTGALVGPIDLVAQNTNLNFINAGDATVISEMNGAGALCTSAAGGGFTGGFSVSSAPALLASAPDAAFSDEFQSSAAASVATCPTISPAIVINGVSVTTGAAMAAKLRAANLVEAGGANTPGSGTASGTVGVIPFEWVLGNYAAYTGSNAPFTNITQQTAHAVIEGGAVPVAFFNANWPTATTDWVYLTGRSEDSGTRINSLAEPQNGFGNPVQQFLLTFSNNQKTTGALPQPVFGVQVGGNGATVQSMDFWPSNAPVNTEPSINWNTTGHGGYVSGGDVGNVLAATLPSVVNTTGTVNDGSSVYIPNAPAENTGVPYLVGYIGVADAGGTVSTIHNATILSYNGVPYSVNAVLNGSYSFWGFEHLWYIKSGFGQVGSTQKTFLDNLADVISTTFAPSNSNGVVNSANGDGAGIIYNPNAGVSKTQEGDIIGVNY